MSLTVAQLVARLTADTSGFYKGMAVANASMIRSGGIIGRLSAGMGLAVIGIGVASSRAAANFEQSMNILQAVSGATGDEMKRLTKNAKDLGTDLTLPNVSAKDAADAMRELGKAGYDVNTIIAASKGVLQLGIAGQIGYADAAKITSTALKGFGLEGNQATRVANLFAATVNASNAEISDLGFGFQAAAGQFAGARYSIEDLSVSLAILVDRGLSGEYAGNALKIMMMRLQAPTKKAQAAMNDMGISVYDAAGVMRPMPELIGQFAKATENMSDKEKNAALITIFGARANQAMQKLLIGGVDSWGKYAKKIVDTNAAQEYAAAVTAGLNGKIGGLGSVMENLAISIGERLNPYIKEVVISLTQFAVYLDKNSDAILDFIGNILSTVAGFVSFIAHNELARTAVAALVAGFAAFVIVNSVISMFKALQVAILAANAAMLANPIVLIIAALVALGVALVLAYQQSEQFRAIVDAAWSWIKANVVPVILEFAATIKRVFGEIVTSVNTEGQKVVSFVQTHWNTIRGIIVPILDFLKAYIKASWEFIKSMIESQLKLIQGVIKVVMGLIKGDWSMVWDGIKSILSAAWIAIKAVITGALSVVKATMSLAWAAIRGTAVAAWNSIKSSISNAWDSIVAATKAKMVEVKTTVSNGFKSIWTMIEGFVETARGAANTVGRAIIQGIWNGFSEKLGWLKGKIEAGLSFIKDLSPFSPVEHGGATYIGAPLALGAGEGFLKQMPAFQALMNSTIAAAVMAVGDEAKPKSKTVGEKMGDAVKEAVSKKMEELRSEMGRLAGLVVDAMADKLARARDVAQNAFSGLSSAMSQAFDAKQAGVLTPAEKILKDMKDTEAAARLQGDLEKALAMQAAANAMQMSEEKNKAQQEAEKAMQAAVLAIRVAELEKQAAEERKQLDIQNGLKKEKFNEALTNLTTHLADTGASYGSSQKQIIALLNSFGIDYQTSGLLLGTVFAFGLREKVKEASEAASKVANQVKALKAYQDEFKSSGQILGDNFAEGLRKSIPAVTKAAQAVAQAAANNIKLRSPAKEGPMSDLHTWWTPFADTLLQGLNLRDILGSVREAFGVDSVGITRAGSTPFNLSSPSSDAMHDRVVNVYQTIEGSLIRESELNDRIRDALIIEERRGRTT